MNGRDWGEVVYETPQHEKDEWGFFLVLVATMAVMMLFMMADGAVRVLTGHEVDGDGGSGWTHLLMGSLFSAVFCGVIIWGYGQFRKELDDPTDQPWTRVYERGLELYNGPRAGLGRDDDNVIPIERLRSIKLTKTEVMDGMETDLLVLVGDDGEVSEKNVMPHPKDDVLELLLALGEVRPDLVDDDLQEYIGPKTTRRVFSTPPDFLARPLGRFFFHSFLLISIVMTVVMNSTIFLFDLFPEEMGGYARVVGIVYSVIRGSMLAYVFVRATSLLTGHIQPLRARVEVENIAYEVPFAIGLVNDVRTSIPISEVEEARPGIETRSFGHVGRIRLTNGDELQVSYDVIEDLHASGRFRAEGMVLRQDAGGLTEGGTISKKNPSKATSAFILLVLWSVLVHLLLREWLVPFFESDPHAFFMLYGIFISALGAIVVPTIVRDRMFNLRNDGLKVTSMEVHVPRYRRPPRTIDATDIIDIRTAYLFWKGTVRVRTELGVLFLPLGAGYRFRESGFEVRDGLGLLHTRLDRPSWPWAD